MCSNTAENALTRDAPRTVSWELRDSPSAAGSTAKSESMITMLSGMTEASRRSTPAAARRLKVS
ncbi:hypothetical protein ABZ953_09245 [Streptomyces sp. NPDC046465]|uniref:hypothetical protein n=1 Tax=Streptomyces sp. NPDC046465 TaxID=3155810 RepID=UPI003400E59A